MTGPRVLLIGEGWPSARPGGLNRYVEDLLAALRDGGVIARAVLVGPAAAAPDAVVVAGDATHSLLARMRATAAATAAAAPHAEVLDTHFAIYGLIPALAGKTRHLARVVHFHGPWADEGEAGGGQHPAATWAKRRIERVVYRRAAAVVTLSGAFRQLAVERYRVSPWRTHVIPPAVDLERFTPGDVESARARWGIDAGTHVVVCVRRLVPRTGVADLLTAWASLPMSLTADSGRLLLIAGDGPEREGLIALGTDLGVGQTVRFLGAVPEEELLELYRAGDVAVVPSRSLEGFGLVVLEALASGCAVIVTDSGGLPEAVAGLGADVVVPVGRPDLLAARLEDARTGTRPLPAPATCRAHAEGYSRPAMAAAHAALYRAAVQPPTGRPLRVVFLDHCAKLSGAEIAMLRLIGALPDVQAHVVLAEDGPLVGRLLAAGISVEVLPLDPAAGEISRDAVRPGSLPLAGAAHSAWYVARVAARLRALRPDVVHANSLKACVYGSLAGRAVGLPVVWHARDRIAADYLPAPAVRLVQTLSRAAPQAVIANSAATLATLGPRRPARVAAVVPDPYRRVRPCTAMPTGPLRVGVVGRLADWKGQHVVLEAFAAAFPTGDQRCVVIGAALFGEDDYAAGLETLAARLGIADRVEFPGFRDDVEAEIDRLQVVVHASVVPEPFGQVVVEAMAAGRVAVATSAGGPAEIIHDEVDGLLYPPGDVAALAAALRRLDGDPACRERLAAAGALRAADYDPDVIGPAARAVYRRLVGAR